MAKAARVLCDRCESRITAGISFCGHCGYPTRWASHEERTTWEVSQWKTSDRSHAPGTPSQSGRASRRWLPRPFGRKTEEKPALTLVPKTEVPVEIAEPVPVPAVAAAPEPAPSSTAIPAPVTAKAERATPRSKPLARTAAIPAPKIARSPVDAEPLTDTPATVMAMRLLNARVAELDARLQQLEAELGDRHMGVESLSK